MMKNKVVLFSILFGCSVFMFGQRDAFKLIELDSTWGQEVLRFPARNMDYIGVGEVRFPPKGWIEPSHPNFWSYTYAWKINIDRPISTKEMALNLVKYFNSLNKIDMDDTKNKDYSTAKVIRVNRKKKVSTYRGTVKIFDRFATNKSIVLNVKIESHTCKKKKTTVLLFKFSPKGFKHKTWEILEKVKLLTSACDSH